MANYFVLQRAALGGGTGVKNEMILYLGVAVGTVARWLFDFINGTPFAFGPLVVGLIVSLLIFPGIYNHAGLKQAKLTFAKWCIAFQNGFFWPVFFEQLAKKFT